MRLRRQCSPPSGLNHTPAPTVPTQIVKSFSIASTSCAQRDGPIGNLTAASRQSQSRSAAAGVAGQLGACLNHEREVVDHLVVVDQHHLLARDLPFSIDPSQAMLVATGKDALLAA